MPREREEHLEEKQQYVQHTKNNILGSLGIGHTVKTKVGNEFIRGVSGGERKRVSLAEMMAGHVSTRAQHSVTKRPLRHSRVQCNSGINRRGVSIPKQL